MTTENPIFSREALSPDGRLRVAYNYVDGERSPLIVEPRVTRIADGAVVLDLWGSCLDGTVVFREFPQLGLRVCDPYSPTRLDVTLDLTAGSFQIDDEPGPGRPVRELARLLRDRIDAAHEARLATLRAEQAAKAAATPPPAGLPRWWRWLWD